MQFKNLEEIKKYLSNDKHYTPNSIIDLISKRIENIDFTNKVILETSVGEANILSRLIENNHTMKNAKFIICDIEENNIKFSRQRLMLEHQIKEENITSFIGNTLELTKELQKYDIDWCFQNPPFGAKGKLDQDFFKDLFKKEKLEVKNTESLFWDLAMRLAKQSFSILPVGCLFRSGWENKVIEININKISSTSLLPSNIFATTGIPVVLVESSNVAKQDVVIGDFTDLCEQVSIKYAGKSKKVNQINKEQIDLINQTIDNCFSGKETQICKMIKLETIKRNKYNLNITRYVQRVIEKEIDIDQLAKDIDANLTKLVNLDKQISNDLELLGEDAELIEVKSYQNITKQIKELLK